MSNQRILIRAKLCRDCQACALACSLYHEGECSPSLSRVLILKDMANYKFHILLCHHCKSPQCIVACPTDAMTIDEQGVVTIVEEDCIRCEVCASSCPHHAIFYDEIRNRYIKCDLCAGRPEGPVCVEVCPVGALTLKVLKPDEVEV
jgi:Fe-S-cluster-containing hydrogenase component 2